MNNTKRLFVALPLPKEILTYVQQVQHDLQNSDCFTGSFPLPEHQHITLSFLGNIDEYEIEPIKTTLTNISYTALQLQLSTIDCFSSEGKIRVLFIHVICSELYALVQDIQAHLSSWIKPENYPFIPHITLARIKTVSDRHVLLNFINFYPIEKMEFTCHEFILFESIHENGALRHKILQKYI